MADEILLRDGNRVPVLGGITNDVNEEVRMIRVNPSTNRVLVDATGSGLVTGSGSAGQVAYWSGASSISGENNLFWDATNNRLGIGTATPAYTLDVSGQLRVTQESIFGTYTSLPSISEISGTTSFKEWNSGITNGTISYNLTATSSIFSWLGKVGIGTASPDSKLHIIGSGTTSSTYSLNIKDSSGNNLFIVDDGGDVFLGNSDWAKRHRILIDGTTSDSGFYVTSYNSSLVGGTLTLYGTSNIIGYSQSLGDFQFSNQNGNLMYLSSTGSLGIGTTSPTAWLHLGAGTATANQAPLKFTTGTNLATPESGAIEFDGTELYLTPASTRYKLAQVVDGSSTMADNTYTPTITGVNNVTSSTAYVTGYYRHGNRVTIFGQVEITATANNTQTTFRMSLPIASNFANTYEAGGGGYTQNNTVAGHGINISADTTNKELQFDYFETHGASDVFNFTASYSIIP